MSRHAAVYARQSLDRDGQGMAVGRQVEDCRKLADLRGWNVTETYVDNDASATKGPRPEYDRLVADMRDGRINVVIVWATDRLTRRLRTLAEFIDLAQRHNIVVATVAGDLDLSTANGRMVAGILGSVAQGEVEAKGDRQRRANRQRAESGHIGWTRRPYGYDRRQGRVVLVDTEAAVLRDAARRVLAGDTMAAVCRDLDARGITTASGGGWTVTTLRRLLLSPRHAGMAVYRGGEHVTNGTWPAVFDLPTHERLSTVLRDPRRRTAPSTESKYLLSGLAVCGRCGERLFASPMGPKGRYWMVYRCLTSHLARRLDLVDLVVVEDHLLPRLARPDAAALLAGAHDVDVVALQAEAVELRDRRDELAGLRAEGLLTAAGLRSGLEAIRGRLADLERAITDATVGADGALSDLVAAEDVWRVWDALPLRDQRRVLDLLVTVTVLPAAHKGARFDADDVRVEWKGQG